MNGAGDAVRNVSAERTEQHELNRESGWNGPAPVKLDLEDPRRTSAQEKGEDDAE
jgi:hypothetical protein